MSCRKPGRWRRNRERRRARKQRVVQGNAARRVELHFQRCALGRQDGGKLFACRVRRLWSEVGGKCSGASSRSSSFLLHHVADLHGRKRKGNHPMASGGRRRARRTRRQARTFVWTRCGGRGPSEDARARCKPLELGPRRSQLRLEPCQNTAKQHPAPR
jgi:hypothetical protein